MQTTANAVRTAVRVLNALAVECTPDPADVDELRRLAPGFAGIQLDVLAWEVIPQAARCRDWAVDSRYQVPGMMEWIS
jgi:hypothetical protein